MRYSLLGVDSSFFIMGLVAVVSTSMNKGHLQVINRTIRNKIKTEHSAFGAKMVRAKRSFSNRANICRWIFLFDSFTATHFNFQDYIF